MGGEVCHQVNKERGPWFEIEEIKNLIISIEKRGADATFERGLLKAWGKVEGYERAKGVLKSLGKPLPH